MDIRLLFATFAALLLFTPAPSAQGVEVPLEYVRHAEWKHGVSPATLATIPLDPQCPPGEWRLPELVGETPRFALLQLADSKILVVVDRSHPGGAHYDRLRLDCNGNGDLTDDPVLTGHMEIHVSRIRPADGEDGESSIAISGNVSGYISFGSDLEIQVRAGGKHRPYWIRCSLRDLDPRGTDNPLMALAKDATFPEAPVLSFESAGSFLGTFTIDGEEYRVAVGDGNTNGTFSDPATAAGVDGRTDRKKTAGDVLLLTRAEMFSRRDRYSLPSQLLLGDRLFDVVVDAGARRLSLTPSRDERFPLRLAAAPARMILQTQDGARTVVLDEPGEVARLPRGRYGIVRYELRKSEPGGSLWRLEAVATDGTPFTVLENADGADLAFGEPFVPRAVVAPANPRDELEEGAVRLAFRVTGEAREELTGLARLRGTGSAIAMSAESRNRPREPSYSILEPSGERVAQGRFEYG